MHATARGAARYVERYPEFRDAGCNRTVFGLRVSSLGIGAYLGAATGEADRAIDFFDCAINYRHRRPERSMGAALKQLRREETVAAPRAPETQLNFVATDVFEERIARAFGRLETLAAAGKICRCGTARWDGYRKPNQLSLPGLGTTARRAIRFTPSTPGIAVGLVGMGQRKRVAGNIGVAGVAPAAPDELLRLSRPSQRPA